VISPLIANLFLHHALDAWIRRKFPSAPFERYADDVVAHSKTREEAKVFLGCYPRMLLSHVETIGKPCVGNPHARFERRIQ